MSIDDAKPARPLPPRDQWGRYLIKHPVTGAASGYQRMTTFAGLIQDEHAINQWRMRAMLAGFVERPDLWALARSLTDPVDDQKKQANDLNEEAMQAGKISKKANMGTSYHQFTETIDEGGTPNLETDEEKADMAAYKRTLDLAGFEVVEIETICVNFTYGYAGTLDRLLRHRATGNMYIGDVKTGAQPHRYPHEICLQLGGYNHAEYFYRYRGGDPTNLDNWECVPAPTMAKNKAVVIHLIPGSGECNLYWFNTGAGWEMFDALKAVRTFRNKRDLVKPVEMPKTAAAVVTAHFPEAEVMSEPTAAEQGSWNQTIHEAAPVLPTEEAFTPTPPIPAAPELPTVDHEGDDHASEFEGGDDPEALTRAKTALDGYDWPKGCRQQKLMAEWLTQGGQSKRPWRLTSSDLTERRGILYLASIDLLNYLGTDPNEEVVQALICWSLSEEYQYGPKFKIGKALGSMSCDQAIAFADDVDCLCSGAVTTSFNVQTGKPEIMVVTT